MNGRLKPRTSIRFSGVRERGVSAEDLGRLADDLARICVGEGFYVQHVSIDTE